MKKIIVAVSLIALTFACKSKEQQDDTEASQKVTMAAAPAFNADSAYAYIEKQVAFGPRVPNTPAHVQTGNYLVSKLKQFGCEVTEQTFVANTWDGKKLNARNIIGSINPGATKRIVLASHWDSRPHADQDPDAADKNKPVTAANDGASGVGVLLELARTIQAAKDKPDVGIDIVFFDAEDWGSGEKVSGDYEEKSGNQYDYLGFCLGSRYWAKNLHKPGYSAYYGILLDMVGAKGATFAKEGYSMQFAPTVVNNVWQTASQLGYSQFFVDTPGSQIVDDHIAPNTIAKIPMIDIIHTNIGSGGFFPGWHTAEDNMSYIDRSTLKAVGQTVMQVLYNEQ
ncbi:M28 family peptidase [Spirosoma sp. KUDC1026]|uniref:M28 family peptidase n=1 Tax=Spirosoma sp. KUDC1026 TaxID=2745947 RepID=UPI00159B8720|nr:M28 family peptidase [Spirosoma sp. KUDC1026]QKZ11640.1 M28 family peptidase [Spirosoma sp. KUDC1026]